MASVLTTIKNKKRCSSIHTQCNHHTPKRTQFGKYSIYPANKCRKQKLTAERVQIYFLLFTPWAAYSYQPPYWK